MPKVTVAPAQQHENLTIYPLSATRASIMASVCEAADSHCRSFALAVP